MEMQFFDTAPLTGVRVTRDGYLVADALVGALRIQIYSGAALGRPEAESVPGPSPRTRSSIPTPWRRWLTAPSLSDTRRAPSTLPTGSVCRSVRPGTRSRACDYIRAARLMDAAAIRAVVDGKRQLS